MAGITGKGLYCAADGRKVVNTLVTEYAVFKFKDGMMFLLEHTSDVTLEELQQ